MKHVFVIAAALLAVPGASAYFRGGAVLYTRAGWRALRDYKDDDFAGTTPSLFDAYLNYRYRPELQLRAGKLLMFNCRAPTRTGVTLPLML